MRLRCLVLLLFASIMAKGRAADPVKLTGLDDRVRVEVEGKLFTEYVFKGASRPYCYPVLAADGTSLTRDFPMKETPGEDRDHPWQRALQFAHADLNNVDFWNEPGGGMASCPPVKGQTLQDGAPEIASGEVGVLRVRNRYVAADGRLICTDERTVRFHGTKDARFMDWEVTLHALPDTPLRIGDNKDGVMAVRVAQWLTGPHKVKGVETGGLARIVTANGDLGDAAWGKRAPWCDFNAQHAGQVYGIALFDHPQNLRHPTWWMARAYGLFAANPFGWHDFEPKTTPPNAGTLTLPPGGTLTLRYRFYFHLGDEKTAGVAEHYAEYQARSASAEAR